MVPPVSHGVSRVPRYSGSRLTELGFRLRGSHPLWPAFPYRSANLSCRCVGPQPRRINPSVCPLPRSLATTSGISVDFSSSPYLDVSVQAVPHLRLFDSTQADGVLLRRVSPFGDPGLNAYVQLPQAYRSLSRPSSAPDAKAFPLRSFQLDLVGVDFVSFASACRRKLSHSVTPPLPRRPACAGLCSEKGQRVLVLSELCRHQQKFLLGSLFYPISQVTQLALPSVACSHTSFCIVQFSRCQPSSLFQGQIETSSPLGASIWF